MNTWDIVSIGLAVIAILLACFAIALALGDYQR